MGKVYLPLYFYDPDQEGGLDFDLDDDDQGTLGTWFIDINHYDTEHDQL